MSSRIRSFAICVLLLLSGACSLAYENVWLRELRLVFGGTTAASAAVFAIFMGGLGFGGSGFRPESSFDFALGGGTGGTMAGFGSGRGDGMGGGDIKLLAMIGAMIGWQGILFTLFAASAIGTLVGVLAMIRSGKGMRLAIPFGPFLAAAGWMTLLWGNDIIQLYLQ